MIILEVKVRHARRAAETPPSGFLRGQSLKNGIKRWYQYAFGVLDLVGRILAESCSF